MKKKVALLLLVLACVLALAACSGFGGGKTDGGDPMEVPSGPGGPMGMTITISFDTDGGSTHEPIVFEGYESNWTSKLPTPTKEGYKFLGWYNEGTEVNPHGFFSKDTTLTAKWEAQYYKVTLHAESRFADLLPFTETEYGVDMLPLSPEPDSRYGYRFAGWYTDETYTTRVDAIGAGTGYLCDIDLYGKFELDPFDIYENSNGTCTFGMKDYTRFAAAVTAEELASVATVVIPATYNGKPVVHIEYAAFSGWSSITSIEISEGVLNFPEVGDVFLADTAITSLTLPDSILVVNSEAVQYALRAPGGQREYKGGIYAPTATNPYAIFVKPAGDTPITSIELHPDTCIIAPYAFVIDEHYNNWVSHPITAISFGSNLKSICESAFAYCNELKSVEIPAGLLHIDNGAFNHCEITTLIAPLSSLNSVSLDYVENLTLTGGTEIGEDTLSDCKALKSITLCDSITNIHENAFANVSTLQSVNIGTGVTSIKQLSFLDKISGLVNTTTYNGCSYMGNASNPYFLLYRANSAMTSVVIHEDTKVIWKNAFATSNGLAKPTIPESVVSVGTGAFSGAAMSTWEGITANGGVYVGNTANPYLILTKIAYGATEFTMHKDAQCYGTDIFAGNASLVSVTLPVGITKITSDTFAGCNALESIYIPDGVTEIGDYAFRDLPNLKSLRLPNTLVKVGRNIVNFNILHNPSPRGILQ